MPIGSYLTSEGTIVVVATDCVSVDANRDNGADFRSTRGCRGGIGDTANRLSVAARSARRRLPSSRPLGGLPDLRFHDLRHTCATLLLTKGTHPRIVSEMLGHSPIAITLDTYSHVIPRLGGVAIGAVEEVHKLAGLVRGLISYASMDDYTAPLLITPTPRQPRWETLPPNRLLAGSHPPSG